MRLILPVLLAGLLVVVCGCGSKATVSGKVMYKNRPVLSGSIILSGPDGVAAVGPIGPDGRFEVSGVEPGKVKVGVSSPQPNKEPPAVAARKGVATKVPPPPKDWFPLPDNLGQPETSGLTIDIAPGSNQKDITVD